MKKHKYFSQLTPKQKDKANRLFFRAKLGLLGLDANLQRAIISGIEIERIYEIYDQLRGCKMFYYIDLNCYIPLNIKELLNKN